VVRLLIAEQDRFLGEAREVLRAALSTAAWITVDDTGARHKPAPGTEQGAVNGFCTQIGNAHFAWFGTTASKSRLNFLELLRAGHQDYVINAEALAYMRGRHLAARVIALLASHAETCFADRLAWQAHLQRLGIATLEVTPDPVCIATEGALWGSIKAHGYLSTTAIISDERRTVRHRSAWPLLGARRASGSQARHLHRPTARRTAAHPRPLLVVLSRPQSLPGRGAGLRYARASTGSSSVAPALPPSIACSNAFTPTNPSCSSSWIVPRSRFTPTDRRTTSVAK